MIPVLPVESRWKVGAVICIALLFYFVWAVLAYSSTNWLGMLVLFGVLAWILVETMSWYAHLSSRSPNRFAAAYQALFDDQASDNSAAVAVLRKYHWPTPNASLLKYVPDCRRVKNKENTVPRMLELGFGNFTKADLTGLSLVSADFRWANLCQTRLDRSILFEAQLDHANLIDAHAVYSRFQYASLQNITARGIVLSGADLRYARLNGASMEEANLRNADLRFADISGTVLADADLSGANFTEVTWQSSYVPNLRGATIDEETQMPNSLMELYQQQNHSA